MKLGIVYNNFLSPTYAGGGAVHSYEVTIRLKKYFDIIYFPSSPVFIWSKETLEKKAKDIESKGIKIAPEFYAMLDKYEKYHVSSKIKKLVLSDKIAREVSKNYTIDVDLLYEPDHTSFDIFYLDNKINFGLTIHEPLFYNDSWKYLKRLFKFYRINLQTGKGFYTRFLYNELISKPKYKSLLKKKKPLFIASVSKGSLEESGLEGEVIMPGNAFDSRLLNLRGKGKDDYIVFWSRLNQDKGIHEIPDILKKIYVSKRIKLILMGKFLDKYNEKLFWNKVKKYNIDVEYLGFVTEEKLHEIVSRAKLLIYPSHVDGFSLVVLEALALGTPVVAYGIPAIRSVYGSLKTVKIVNEFDMEKMAKEALNILSMSESEIEDFMNDSELLTFLKLHSSWDNVANSVKNIILNYLNKYNA